MTMAMARVRRARRCKEPNTATRHLATPAADTCAWRWPPHLPARRVFLVTTMTATCTIVLAIAMTMALVGPSLALDSTLTPSDTGEPTVIATGFSENDGNPDLETKVVAGPSSSGRSSSNVGGSGSSSSSSEMSGAKGKEDSGQEGSAKRLYLVSLNNLPPVSMYASDATAVRTATTLTASSASSLSSSTGGDRGGSSNRPQYHTTAARAYADRLVGTHSTILEAAGIPRSARVTSYKYVVNGFAAMLTEEQASELRQQRGVAAVQRSRTYHPMTDNVPKFLQLPSSLWQSSGSMDSAGEDMIIGVVDSGIWPEHPSFQDNVTVKPYGPVPARWRGTCSTSSDFPASLCNRKLIGAQYFAQGWIMLEGYVDTSIDYQSPRDVDGHGTWCAGASAGNSRVNANVGGSVLGQITGMAPRARVAVYKVCWYKWVQGIQETYCPLADVFSAIDKATADGVDIISMSLGGRGPEDFFGPFELGLLRAWLAGVVLVLPAGNEGNTALFNPNPQVVYAGPWSIVVAASTANRTQTVFVQLGNGTVLSGLGFKAGNSNTVARPLIISTRCAWDYSSQTSLGNAYFCYPGSLNPAICGGAIVVCSRGNNNRYEKSEVVKAAGGVGFILTNPLSGLPKVNTEMYAVPGMLLTLEQGDIVREYHDRAYAPTATILPYPPAPRMASFSSRGPVVDPANDTVLLKGPSPHTMKPDITAPGVDLLGAWVQLYANQRSDELVEVSSGTSMATPIVAGLAALLRQQYPAWGPARIKSAIMTTASQVDNSGQPIKTSNGVTPANPTNYGAGHVSPPGLLYPGLVYDAGQADYYSFLAGIDSTAARSLPGVTTATIPQASAGYNLNEPYIWVAKLRGSVNVTRRVVNVAGINVVFTARVVTPPGVTMVVVPAKLKMARGASAAFVVQLTARTSTREFRYGSLTWVGGTRFSVRSVIGVQPLSTS